MLEKIINNFSKAGFKLFIIGVFLLPSVPAISSLFLLTASFASLISNSNLLKNKLNVLLIALSIFMIATSAWHFLKFDDYGQYAWDKQLSFIGLINWIPLFYLFSTSQLYLKTSPQRYHISLALLAGSVPVLISGFLQFFVNLEGPKILLNGLIIWFMKPIHDSSEGLSGLFSNQNYAGTWFAIIWPFALTVFLNSKNNLTKKIISFGFLISIILSIILTTSKNALLGLIISIPLILGTKGVFIIFLSLLFLIMIGFNTDLFAPLITEIGKEPKSSLNSILNLNDFIDIKNNPRILIWSQSLTLILQKPLMGWGAAFLPVYYAINLKENIGEKIQHAHNIFLEIGVGYGLIAAIIISSIVIYILIFSWRKIIYLDNKKDYFFDRAWVTSLTILCLSQLNDITYYDLRISIIFWILLGGSYQLIKTI